MRGVGLAWLTFVGISTWRWESTNAGTLPPPRIYVGPAVLFSIFGLVAAPAPELAGVLAWGLVLAGLTTGALLPPTAPTGG